MAFFAASFSFMRLVCSFLSAVLLAKLLLTSEPTSMFIAEGEPYFSMIAFITFLLSLIALNTTGFLKNSKSLSNTGSLVCLTLSVAVSSMWLA